MNASKDKGKGPNRGESPKGQPPLQITKLGDEHEKKTTHSGAKRTCVREFLAIERPKKRMRTAKKVTVENLLLLGERTGQNNKKPKKKDS